MTSGHRSRSEHTIIWKLYILFTFGRSRDDFIPDVSSTFQSEMNSMDYHDEMNGQHFGEWFEDILIMAMKGPSHIFIANTPYHNIQTPDSTSCEKEHLQQWLRDRGIMFSRGVTIQEKRIVIFCDIFSLYCDILQYIVFLIFSVKSN